MTDRIAFAGPVSVEGRRVRGSVTLAGSRTFRHNEWVEVDPAAVVKADASDVLGRWEHDPSKVLGRSSNGTVRVNRTEQGIEYEIDVPDTTYGNDLLELLNRGDIRGSSFAIEGLKSKFSTDPDGTRVRRINSIQRLVDVSPVTDPAFANSSAAAFSKETTDMAETTVEPTAPVAPAPTPAPAVEFTAKPDEKSETYRRAAHYAESQELKDLEAAMGNLLAHGEMSDAQAETYAAMADVYERRTSATKTRNDNAERRRIAFEMITGRGPAAPKQTELYESEDYHQAFASWLRTGDPRYMTQFAQSIAGDGTQGGYTVPEGFRNKIVETMVAFGGIASVADVIETGDGRTLPWPTNDDTGNQADLVTEGSATAAGADLVFGEVSLGAYSYDASGASNLPLKLSKELIQDSMFDIEGFVARKLGERLARKMAAVYATGTGSGQPKGLFALSADTMTATTLLAALVEHLFQIDSAYRDGGNCRWVFSDTTLAKVYGSVDLNNRPLFIPSADASGAGRPAGTLLGYPVTLDQGAGTKVAFGDIREGFVIRRVKGITVDVDPYSYISTRHVGFHAWARTDSNIQNTAAYSVSEYSGVSADATA